MAFVSIQIPLDESADDRRQNMRHGECEIAIFTGYEREKHRIYASSEWRWREKKDKPLRDRGKENVLVAVVVQGPETKNIFPIIDLLYDV